MNSPSRNGFHAQVSAGINILSELTTLDYKIDGIRETTDGIRETTDATLRVSQQNLDGIVRLQESFDHMSLSQARLRRSFSAAFWTLR